MVKTRELLVGCALVVLSLTFAGCTQKEAEQEKTTEPGVEAPATETPAATEEMPMAPAEGEPEAVAETPEGEEEAVAETSEGEEGK